MFDTFKFTEEKLDENNSPFRKASTNHSAPWIGAAFPMQEQFISNERMVAVPKEGLLPTAKVNHLFTDKIGRSSVRYG